MADTVTTLTQSMKIFFEEQKIALMDFVDLFFPTRFTTDADTIPVDELVDTRTLAGYRAANGASNVLKYNPGKGTIYEPPTVAIKSPVSADLAGAVTAGMSANDPVSAQLNMKYARLQNQHSQRIYGTIVKQAMDIFTTGAFTPVDASGNAVGDAISFGRATANTVTPADWSAVPVTQLQKVWDALDAKNAPKNGRYMIVGSTVLSRLEAHADFKAALEIQGLASGKVWVSSDNAVVTHIVTMKMPGRAGMVTILAFNEYYVNGSGVATPFMPVLGVIGGSFLSPRTQAYAGIFITDPTRGVGERFEGEVITDRYVEKDPDGLVLRTQSRPLLIPGIVDHTAYAASTT